MSAVDEVIALLTARVEHHRIGRSTWREMDHDILAMRKAIELLQAPTTDEDRFAFAEFLDDLHGPYIEEGGCSFRPVRYGWRPGDVAKADAGIVDPILERARRLEAPTPNAAEREAQSWREANLYNVDSVSQNDFMAGWRAADRLRP